MRLLKGIDELGCDVWIDIDHVKKITRGRDTFLFFFSDGSTAQVVRDDEKDPVEFVKKKGLSAV